MISVFAQRPEAPRELDGRVEKFLNEKRGHWHDWNVPYGDGKVLYNLIIKNNYRRALEIGTSTGHSAIWMAWALSKTGGKLITIEIDEERHKEALANFEKAGVARFVDARLADAHELVKKLPGPFDFVFSDADKEWNKQYFVDVAPKMAPGGCFTTHNVSMRGRGWGGGNRDYVDYLMSRPEFETSVETTRTSGIAVTFRKRD
jgi:predicted O-methyltransferase YrrM